MAFTPLDIQNAEFKVSFRGYNQSEVDSFLNRILVDYEKLYKENQIIKEELKRLKSDIGKYKNIENNLSATLVLAQETSYSLRETAEKEAKLIIQEADIEARTMREEVQKEIEVKEKELQMLINEFSSYKLKMLSFLETQYRIIKDDAFISVSQDEGLAEAASIGVDEANEKTSTVNEEELKEQPDEQKPNEQKVD